MGQERGRQIVRILERTDTWTTAAALADELGCSPRTVKSDVAALNRASEGLVEASGRGYRLANLAAAEGLLAPEAACGPEVPQNAEERKRQILFDLLMRRRAVSAEDLAERLCISLSTLDNELVPIKRELAGYGLVLCQRAGSLFVDGSDANEKKLVNQLIFDETKGFFTQLDVINRYFPQFDLRALQADIDRCLRDAGYYINGYALSNLILHVAIFAERAMNGFSPSPGAAHETDRDEDAQSTRGASGRVDEDARGIWVAGLGAVAGTGRTTCAGGTLGHVVRDVRAVVERACGIVVGPADTEALALMLSANLTHPGEAMPDDPAWRSTLSLFGTIERRVREEFGLDLSDREFQVRFSLHLANLLARARQGSQLRNSQLHAIKDGYPFIYDVAVFVADEVCAATGVQANEDEIAYIALHLGCLAEEQRACADKLHAVFVCLRHNANDAARIEAFSRELDGSVVIDGVVGSPDALEDASGIDLLVSNVPVAPDFPVPVVSVTPFLGQRDAQAVSERARTILRGRRRANLERGMRTFFREDLFAIEPAAEDWRDVMLAMSEELVRRGFAFEDFPVRLLERERMAPSVYGDIAMPHPVDMDARQTAVSVALFPRGLSWGGTTVYLVVMLAIRRDDRGFFRDIFEHIASVLNNPGAVRVIARARSFEEFTEALLSYV